MAVNNTSTVPPLGLPVLGRLRNYLLERNIGEPSVLPTPLTLVTSNAGGGMDLDVLTWSYEQPNPRFGRVADGFILWILEESTGPAAQGFKVSEESRAFRMIWPNAF